MAKDILNDVNPDHYFWLADGRILKGLKELHQALQTMDEGTFRHHVNEEKNDFHNWVRDLHQDESLAKDILSGTRREEVARIIGKKIKESEKARGDAVNEKVQKVQRGVKVRQHTRKTNPAVKAKPAVKKARTKRLTEIRQKKKTGLGCKKKASQGAGLNLFPAHQPWRFALAVAVAAIAALTVVIWLGGNAATITGAAVGTPARQEIQFARLGIMAAVIILAVVALKMYAERNMEKSREKKNDSKKR